MPDRVEYVHPSMAACLLAVGHGARSVTEVGLAVNLGRAQTWHWLNLLRQEGLIIWPEGVDGSLRPHYGIVITKGAP